MISRAKRPKSTEHGYRACILLSVLLLVSCAAPQAPPPSAAPEYWSVSRVIKSDAGMVTLFDPTDLNHHEVDPEGWYRYDFAFTNDLESGRFAAVYTNKTGNLDVRLTQGPLSDTEKLAAGPSAVMRLRVINHRLLLAGGDTWPSEVQSALKYALDPRWIAFNNGDYRVVITALDKQLGAQHDVVFQLLPEANIVSVAYAPGIPYLVMGDSAKVMGLGAGGLRFDESCSRVPQSATWSPLSSKSLPLPGESTTINVASKFNTMAQQLQADNQKAEIPILVARNPVPGTIGLFIQPDSWPSDVEAINGEVAIETRVLCAVTIDSVVPGVEGFELRVDPLPGPKDPLPKAVSRELMERFDTWIRQTGDPAWRFKSAQIQRTQGHRSLLLGIMQYLSLHAKHTESLLQESNTGLANRLIEHMSHSYANFDQ